MTSRNRNLAIIGLVLALVVAALLVVIPGSPLSKPTVLGLDLRGGVELVYEGRKSTPQAPPINEENINDAIETIRKRTDSLGVSEPEIQRAGPNQISIGLPDVENADRAIEQVGTTAQLQFYDWEPNILGDQRAQLSLLGIEGALRAQSRRPRTSSRRPRPRTSRPATPTTSRARRPTARTTRRARSSTSSTPTRS